VAEDLPTALGRVRDLVLDEQRLVRAVAAGRRKGLPAQWRRAELRYVDLKAGRRLQVTTYDDTQAFTANHDADDAAGAVDALLAEPFGNWHVEAVDTTLQLRVTKKGEAFTHRADPQTQPGRTDPQSQPGRTDPQSQPLKSRTAGPDRRHDRAKPRLLPEDDPVLRTLGISDAQGRVKPTRQAKYRQVEELLRALDAAVADATAAGALRTPTEDDPWVVVDLGCGNAYLTFAALRYLAGVRGIPVRVVGVDSKAQAERDNTRVASELGLADRATFVEAEIGTVELPGTSPDVVLALHACDTATDDALARAVRWEAPLVLAAPCCHHDVAAQLKRRRDEAPSALLVRDGILRERFADTLTDALRAGILREQGYRVDVVEFVESKHTPRNTLLRAVRTGAAGDPDATASLAATWHVVPRLGELLSGRAR
jgi:SAM-dependent methyltransferase